MLNITNNSYITKKLNFLSSIKSSTLLSSSSSSSSSSSCLTSIQTPISSPSKINHYNNNNNKYDKIVFFTFSLLIFILGIFSVIYLLEIITNNTTNDAIKQSFNNNYYHHHGGGGGGGGRGRRLSLDINNIEKIVIEEDTELARGRNQNCSYWDCFNVYKCGQQATGDPERIAIYVYPLQEFIDQSSLKTRAFLLTKEFYSILKTIIDSKYYTSNPNEACIFIPSIDILNEHLIQSNLIGKALATLPYWNNGENHLLFNVLSGKEPDYNTVIDVNTDRAMIAGAGFDTWTYRSGFDLAMPFISPILENYKFNKINDKKRSYLLISAQSNLPGHHNRILQQLAYENSDILIFQKCTKSKVSSISSSSPPSVAASQPSQLPPQPPAPAASASSNKINQQNYDDAKHQKMNKKNQKCSFPLGVRLEYPNILSNGVFCLFGRSNKRLGQPIFLEALAANCIPVIMADNIVLPFDEVIDWSLATVQIREADLHTIKSVLNAISKDKIMELQQQGKWLYEKYLKNINRIVLTILDELNDRVFPHLAKTYLEWNLPMNDKSSKNPLFLPLIAPKSQGFTAVILTYDRIDSLFTLIQKLSMVSSLQKILVIWNNQKKSPPHPSLFPKITKPLKVIQTKANKLSNRFFPYEDIETEAILTIDDDIIMLTADELDFGYEVWREFPDRIVGFPSRTHVWDNVTNRWRYESEWTNQISMVLTGAAFHHKYWSYMYTNAMPGDIKEWVDDHMNCEDIAMNFLVANITNKPPIKVAPRKKFKCPECTNTEMLSADLNHMLERSACIDRFAGIYGTMPLKSVEFRADPVLYKDNFPEKLKRFNDIGSL